MTVLFTELNRILFTALYHTFSTSHGIEFTVNDCKIFYGLIPLSFTVCNPINYFFLKSVYIYIYMYIYIYVYIYICIYIYISYC